MMKEWAILLLGGCVLLSCGASDDLEIENVGDAFFANLSAQCDATFTGEATFPDDSENVLVDTELNAEIISCSNEVIEVDLSRDGDTWHATWILERREDGLHLYHDHIGDKEYEQGEEPPTGYGGYADDSGTTTAQYFPADDYTSNLIPEASTNVWMIELDSEDETLVYSLDRHSEPRFRAVFKKVQENG